VRLLDRLDQAGHFRVRPCGLAAFFAVKKLAQTTQVVIGLNIEPAIVFRHVNKNGVDPGQVIAFFFCQKHRQVGISLMENITNGDGRFMQMGVVLFNIGQQRGDGGHHLFRQLTAFAVVPLTEAALPWIGLDLQFGHFFVGQQFVDLVGPVKVVDFPLHHDAAQLVAVDDFRGIADNTADTENRPAANRGDQDQHQPEADTQFFTKFQIFPHV